MGHWKRYRGSAAWLRCSVGQGAAVALALLAGQTSGNPQGQPMAPGLPSARFLVDAWRASSRRLSERLTAFHLTGRASRRTYAWYVSVDGIRSPDPTAHWASSRDGQEYRWALTHHSNPPGIAYECGYDGKGWWQMQRSPGQPCTLSVDTRSEVEDGVDTRSIFLKDPVAYPFDPQQLIDDPTRIGSHLNTLNYGSPKLFDYYMARLPYLRVVGAETVGGLRSFHIRLEPRGAYPHPLWPLDVLAPQDAWLAVIGDEIVPWRFANVQAAGERAWVRNTVQLTGGEQLGSAWAPLGFESTWEGATAPSPARARWQTGMVDHSQVQLTAVDDPQPAGSFAAPSGCREALNGVILSTGESPRAWPRVQPATPVWWLVRAIVVAAVAVGVVALARSWLRPGGPRRA